MEAIHNPYTPYILFGVFVASVFLWDWFQLHIRPLFITKSEIGRKADELLDKHGGGAEYHAYIEEDRAMRYTDTYKQGVWRRIRKELRKRNL